MENNVSHLSFWIFDGYFFLEKNCLFNMVCLLSASQFLLTSCTILSTVCIFFFCIIDEPCLPSFVFFIKEQSFSMGPSGVVCLSIIAFNIYLSRGG